MLSKYCIYKKYLSKLSEISKENMALNKTEIFMIPVLVFVVIIFGIVFIAHFNRFIMQHRRRYCPRFCLRQRWKSQFNKNFLTQGYQPRRSSALEFIVLRRHNQKWNVNSYKSQKLTFQSLLIEELTNLPRMVPLLLIIQNSRGELTLLNGDITVIGRFPFLVSLVLRKVTWIFK